MPSLLEPVYETQTRMLPCVVAMNENHDELGRFASGEGGGDAGSGGSGASKESASDKIPQHAEFDRLYQKAGSPPYLSQQDLDKFRESVKTLSSKAVKELAKKIGVVGNDGSKSKLIDALERRLLSKMETSINTSFANKPLGGR